MNPALFNASDHDPPRDVTDPRAVQCPTCGAAEGRPCRRRWKTVSGPVTLTDPRADHQARWAQARYVAGVADEPAPRLW